MSNYKLGDHVRFSGTVVKKNHFRSYSPHPEELFPEAVNRGIYYEDGPLPGFAGWAWSKPIEEAETFSAVSDGFIVGKLRYQSLVMDEGLWIPDGKQNFVAYQVAWHLSRKPVMVRLDQIAGPA